MEYLTAKQLADKLGITYEALRKRIQRGKVKGEKVGNMWLFKLDQHGNTNEEEDYAS